MSPRTTRFRTNAVVLTGLALVFAFSCKAGDSGGGGTGPSNNWSIAASVSQPTPTIQQSASDTITVTVTRAGGYTGGVTLAAVVLAQGGITASIDNTATAANVTTARLIISIGPSFPAGPQYVNVSVTPDAGVSPVTVPITINIVNKNGVFVIAAATLSVGQGSSATLPVTIRRTNYTLPVPMTLATTQAGLTATFSPNPVTDSMTTMTVQADATVPLGTYSIGARANEGITGFQATAPVTLTVTQPGSITMTLNINQLFVRVGSSTPTGVTIVRNNFSGPITLAATGMPAGVTVAFPVNPILPINPPSMTFTATAGAVQGNYPITITASAAGITSVSVTFTLTVSP